MRFFNLQLWRHIVFALMTTGCQATVDIDPFCTTEFGYDCLATRTGTGRAGEQCKMAYQNSFTKIRVIAVLPNQGLPENSSIYNTRIFAISTCLSYDGQL